TIRQGDERGRADRDPVDLERGVFPRRGAQGPVVGLDRRGAVGRLRPLFLPIWATVGPGGGGLLRLFAGAWVRAGDKTCPYAGTRRCPYRGVWTTARNRKG